MAQQTTTDWRPIEQARRDGSHILVGWGRKSPNPPTVVHWFDDGWYLSFNQDGERALPLTPRFYKPIEDQPA